VRPVVNRWLDLLDRSGWTAVQAAAAALLTYLTDTDSIGWETGLKFVAIAAAISVCKVVVGQRTGTDDTGSLIGTSVIEPSPEAAPPK
jgi:hypothetical protein